MRFAQKCGAGSFFILCGLLLSCGAANEEYTVTPSGEYDKMAETLTDFSRCTPESETYGCGTIVTSGNIVRSDFVFHDLYVTCGTTDNGYTVSLRNSISAASSFQMIISLYGISTPPLVTLCKGPVHNGAGGVVAGSCDVSMQVHSTTLASTPTNQCLVKFLSTTAPISGTVSCGYLESGLSYLTISETSAFTCQ
jgi:hypothetical protein